MAQTTTCYRCKRPGLTFKAESAGQFYMFEADGSRHKCGEGEYEATEVTAPKPADASEYQYGKQPPKREAPAPPLYAEPGSIETGMGDEDGECPELSIPSKIEWDTPQHENLPLMLFWLINMREPVALHGESGSGKSTIARIIADKLFPKAVNGGVNTRFYPMSFNSQTSKGDIRGVVDAMGHFHASPFYYAFRNGGLYLADEFDAGNDNVNLMFNMALSNKQMAFANGEVVAMHPKFFCIAGSNTTGNGADRVFTGRNEIDGATKDRFVWILWDVNEHLELTIAGTDQADWVRTIQAMRRIRKEMGITSNLLTPRASYRGARALRAGAKWAHVEAALIRSLLAPDEWTQLLANLPATVQALRRKHGAEEG